MAGENEGAPQNGPESGAGAAGGTGEGAPQNGPEGGSQGDDGGKPNGDAAEQKPGESDTDWKARSRQHEDRAKANKAAADKAVGERDAMAKVLDNMRKALDPDGAGKDDDPTTIAQKASGERDAARGEARLARVELAAERAARKADADVDALLDSRAFLGRLEQLDPTADDFADQVKKAVEDTLRARPELKAAKTAPKPPASGEMGGGGKKPPADTGGIEGWRKKRRER